MKTPVFSGYYIDNQKLIYEGFKDMGAIEFDCNDFSNLTLIAQKINEYFSDSVFKNHYISDKIKKSKLNILNIFKNLI